jgi:hypothetical protein
MNGDEPDRPVDQHAGLDFVARGPGRDRVVELTDPHNGCRVGEKGLSAD